MAVFRNDQEIKNFVEDFLKEKINADELSSEYQIPSKEGRCYYLTSKNGLPALVMLGVVESHALLRFWDKTVKEKNYRKRNLPFLESNSSKIKEILGDVTYNFKIAVNGFQSNIKTDNGFLVTYDDRDSKEEIKADLDKMFEVVKLMNANDEELQLIRNIDDLKKQLEKVEDSLKENDPSMKDLIKKGRCFVSYKCDGKIHFAPSRFVGYRNKTIEMHKEGVKGNGQKTTDQLDSILGKRIEEDGLLKMLKSALKSYAQDLGIELDKTKHTFWKTDIELNSSGADVMKQNGINEFDKGNVALNTILYGPPGTGKTFNTMAYAVAICEGKNVSEIKNEVHDDYGSVKNRYDALKEAGRIEFVTFHQSYGYEDFIEGIKPDLDDSTGELKYKLEAGCFKSFCDKVFGNFEEAWENLCDKLDDEEKEFLEIPYISDETKTFPIEWNASHNGLKAKGAHRFFNKKQLENVYKKEPGVKKRGHDNYRKAIVKFMQKECGLKEYNGNEKNETLNKAHVFVIDEINRGNISKIFGELITLIEPSKRLGEKESMKVTLPCSGDEFGVPNNVYILGTMNTADRSIAMMDTALRRRFNFVEMMPDTSESSPLNGKIIEGIDICKMLMTINKRIEYLYDREHTIGHAFFIGINDFAGLSSVFRNKVIPLLQEYFYDDYEKIRLVLGDDGKSEEHQFVTKKKPEPNLFRGQVFEDGSDDEKYIYEVNEKAFNLQESYKGII